MNLSDLQYYANIPSPDSSTLYRLNKGTDPVDLPSLGAVARKLQEYAKSLPIKGRPANEKIYLQSVAHGERGPITEKDFSPEELAALKTIVYSKHANNSSAQKGRIGYGDYAGVGGGGNTGVVNTPAGSVKTVLGAAGYQVDPATTEAVVTDTYDFDPIPRPLGPFSNPTKQGMARYLGEQLFPPGHGREVRISLGKLSNDSRGTVSEGKDVSLAEFRSMYPHYNDMPDNDLINALSRVGMTK